MKYVVLGAHLRRDDIAPDAEVLEVPPLFLSAIAVDDDRPLGDRNLLLDAAGVRQKLLGKALFVAIRYGLAVSSAGEAAGKCGEHLERWRQLLEEHRDRVEMTLKVVAPDRTPKPGRQRFSSGAEYLRSIHAWSRAASASEPFRDAVEKELVPLAPLHHWQHRGDGAVELTMLVSRADVDRVLAAGTAVKERFPNVAFLLSGPWPLETYANRHE